VSDLTRGTPSWFPEIEDTHPVPVARTLAEMAEAVFRTQDLQTRQQAEADKQRRRSQALNLEAIRDEAEMRAFMGQPTPTAIEYYLAASEAADRAEAADRKQDQARRIEAQERRIAELEAEVAEAEQARTRSSRTLRAANEGWARARDEAESFRDAARYRAYGR